MIRLPRSGFARILAEVTAGYPHESCGILVGRASDVEGRSKEVVRVVATDNARAEERERRYLIPPDAVRAADEEARRSGLEIVGFYHSHPDHPAEPSAFDREHAWPWYAYLIVEVRRGVPGAALAWRLEDDREAFRAEELVIVEEEHP